MRERGELNDIATFTAAWQVNACHPSGRVALASAANLKLAEAARLSLAASAARMASSSQTAAQIKEAGNGAFKEGRYAEAVRLFTQFLEREPAADDKAKALGNRSAAHAKLDMHAQALSDGRAAVAADPTYVKGYYRLTTALLSLGQPAAAARVAERALALDPANKQMQALYHESRAKAREAGEGDGSSEGSEGDGQDELSATEGETEEETDEEEVAEHSIA